MILLYNAGAVRGTVNFIFVFFMSRCLLSFIINAQIPERHWDLLQMENDTLITGRQHLQMYVIMRSDCAEQNQSCALCFMEVHSVLIAIPCVLLLLQRTDILRASISPLFLLCSAVSVRHAAILSRIVRAYILAWSLSPLYGCVFGLPLSVVARLFMLFPRPVGLARVSNYDSPRHSMTLSKML